MSAYAAVWNVHELEDICAAVERVQTYFPSAVDRNFARALRPEVIYEFRVRHGPVCPCHICKVDVK